MHVLGDDRPGGPAILVFHGSNQTGVGFRRFSGGVLDRLTAGGGVLAYLDGYRKNWNDARRSSRFPARRDDVDDVGFARAAARELAGRYGVPGDRFYAVGFSSGGALVLRLLLEAADALVGAAVISATMPAPANLLDIDRGARPVPTAVIHGTRDRLVPYDGGMASLWGVRPRGLGLSAMDTTRALALRNGITDPPTTLPIPELDDGKTAIVRTSFAQPGHAPVVLYSVHGGGHSVPGPRSAPFFMGRTAHGLVAGRCQRRRLHAGEAARGRLTSRPAGSAAAEAPRRCRPGACPAGPSASRCRRGQASKWVRRARARSRISRRSGSGIRSRFPSTGPIRWLAASAARLRDRKSQ